MIRAGGGEERYGLGTSDGVVDLLNFYYGFCRAPENLASCPIPILMKYTRLIEKTPHTSYPFPFVTLEVR